MNLSSSPHRFRVRGGAVAIVRVWFTALVLSAGILSVPSACASEELNQGIQLDSPFIGGEVGAVSDWPGLGIEGQDALSVPAEGPSGGSTYASWSSAQEAGRYDIQVYIPAEHANAEATYYFGTADGTYTVTLNQAAYAGQWADFGEFSLDAGLAAITSANDVGGIGQELGWSAARWIWTPEPSFTSPESPPSQVGPSASPNPAPSLPPIVSNPLLDSTRAHPASLGDATGNEHRTLAELIAESRFIPTGRSHGRITTSASSLSEALSLNLAHGISLSSAAAPQLTIIPEERHGRTGRIIAPGLVLFASTAPETNTAVQLLGSGGLRIFEVLRGPKSPRRFSFVFHLPAGTHLVRATNGRVDIQTMSGQLIYGVSAPWAFDRRGHSIATYFSLAGGHRLILHVLAAKAAYPVVVDPELIDVALDVAVWTAQQLLKHLNQTINIEPAVCKFTGIACKEVAYAPSDQEAEQLGLNSGPAPQPASSGTGIQTLTPDGSGAQQPSSPDQSVTQYECPNDDSNIGIYVAPGHYWHNNFVAQAGVITGGNVGLGANSDGRTHVAEIGVYSDPGLTQPLGVASVDVSGYGGVRFSFPQPIPVPAGEELYFGVKGVGDFTAYDSRTGCMIGALEGHG